MTPLQKEAKALRETVEELNAGGFPVKNAAYWRRMYEKLQTEHQELNIRLGLVIGEKNDEIKRLKGMVTEIQAARIYLREIAQLKTQLRIQQWSATEQDK